MTTRSGRTLAALAFAGALLAGCSSSSSSTGSSTAASSPPGSGANSPANLSSIATVADMAKQLEAKGIRCKLEYEGLKDNDKTLSICTIDNSQATLTIWDKPEILQKFLAANVGAKGASAVGANWTVDVDTPATAQKVATALGGTVKRSSAPGTTA